MFSILFALMMFAVTPNVASLPTGTGTVAAAGPVKPPPPPPPPPCRCYPIGNKSW